MEEAALHPDRDREPLKGPQQEDRAIIICADNHRIRVREKDVMPGGGAFP